MKKIVCASICLFISPLAMANGFYVGGGAGAIYLKTKLSTTTDFTSEHVLRSTSTDDFPTDTTFNSTLFLGYGHTFKNKAYLALEAFGNWPSLKTEGEATGAYATNTSDLSFNSVYGIRLLPGYQLTPKITAYGIVGYARAKVHTDSTLMGTINSVPSLNTSSSINETLNGYQLGLGAMTKITEHVSLRGDAIYSSYEHTSPVTTTSSNGELTNTYQQTPYTIETDLSLVYQFG